MNTILFDLDGTLLNIDANEFMKVYMEKLYPRLSSIFTMDDFYNYMNSSIIAAIKSEDDKKTNEEIFIETFREMSGKDMKEIYAHINAFYDNEYTKIEGMYSRSKYMIKAVELLKKKKYNLVVATNPLFPENAVNQRIKWAGLDPNDFVLITSIEKMSFCKPNPKYYSQILNMISKDAKDCIMVGNDVQEDLIASSVGIKTYLVEDNIINRLDEKPLANKISDSKGFYKFVKTLPIIPK